MSLVLAMVVAVAIADVPSVGSTTGNGLLEDCARKPKPRHPDIEFLMASSRCDAYLGAIIDQLVDKEGTFARGRFCNGSQFGKGMGAYREVIVAYYAKHQLERRMLAAPKVELALLNAFPCPKAAGEP